MTAVATEAAPVTRADLDTLVEQAREWKRRMGDYYRGRNEKRFDLSERDLLLGKARFQGEQYGRAKLAQLIEEHAAALADFQAKLAVVLKVEREQNALTQEKADIEHTKPKGGEREAALQEWKQRTAPVWARWLPANKECTAARHELARIKNEIRALGLDPHKSMVPSVAAHTMGRLWMQEVRSAL